MTDFTSQWSPSYSAASQWGIFGSKPGFLMNLTIPTAIIGEQQDAPFRARIYTKSNVLVLQADVYQVLVRVYDRAGTEIYGVEEDPLDVIFDTLQAPAAWTADALGANLVLEIPGRGVFLAGGGQYTAEFSIEMADGDTMSLRGKLDVAPAGTYHEVQTQ